MLDTPILQLIDRDPISLEIDQNISDAMRILMSGRIHHLPILRDGKLVGMLSTVDMLELKAAVLLTDDQEWLERIDRHRKLEDVIRKDVISVSDRATVRDAARQLSAGGFHSLPVVDHDYRLVGIVTTTDLIGHMLEALPALPVAAAGDDKLRALERVYDAVQAFLHSGMAAQEQHKLELALDAVRDRDRSVSL
jgi:predicted transcriptional regulator